MTMSRGNDRERERKTSLSNDAFIGENPGGSSGPVVVSGAKAGAVALNGEEGEVLSGLTFLGRTTFAMVRPLKSSREIVQRSASVSRTLRLPAHNKAYPVCIVLAIKRK